MSILIKGALLDGAVTDVYIEKGDQAGRDGSSGTGGSGDRRKA